MPLYVSSTLCSSSGCHYCIIQHLVCIDWEKTQPVHRPATYRCDDTRCCIVQLWSPDDEHIVLETYQHHHHHHHHVSFMELGRLLTCSGLTYPEVSSKVYHDSFCQLDGSVSLPWVIYFEAFYLHVVSSFSCISVICPKLMLLLTPLHLSGYFPWNMYRHINPLNAELNHICHLLALLGAHHIFHVRVLRVNKRIIKQVFML